MCNRKGLGIGVDAVDHCIAGTVCWSTTDDRASILLAICDGTYRSGTEMTVRYAQKLGA